MPPWEERLYRRLLSILPAPFRREAEHELVETFRAARTRALAGGKPGRLRFWVRTLLDLALTGIAERRHRWASVSTRAGHGGSGRRRHVMELFRDLRFILRNLARTPGFTGAAMVTFMLGIGVNIAVLSIVDRMLFRPLPYAEPDRLMHIQHRQVVDLPVPSTSLPRTVATLLRENAAAFEDVAVGGNGLRVEIEGLGPPLLLAEVSYNLLRLLGTRVVAGRDFTEEDTGSSDDLVLLSQEYWERAFGRSAEIFSRNFRRSAGRQTYRIVGVLPRGFLVPASSYPGRLDGVLLEQNAFAEPFEPALSGGSAVARLRGGITPSEAQAEVDVLVGRLLERASTEPGFVDARGDRRFADVLRQHPISVVPLRSGLFFAYRPYVWLIVGAVAAVFLVACVNLATLFLARGRSRERDAAIRSALGASRWRIVRVAIAEAVIVCLVSTAGAFALVALAHRSMTPLVPVWLQAVAVPPLDGRLIVVCSSVAFLAAIVAGGWPAYRTASADVIGILQAHDRAVGSRLRGGAWLLGIEAAFCVLLVAGASITARNLLGLLFKDPGYQVSGLHDLKITHGSSRSNRPGVPLPRRVRGILEEVRAMPGVEAAGAAASLPAGRRLGSHEFWRSRGTTGLMLGIGSTFFQALGTPVRAGREFLDHEIDAPPLVAILSESAARHLWPDLGGSEAVGQTVPTADGVRTVVGVVADLKSLPGEAPTPALYLPLTAPEMADSVPSLWVTVAVRATPGRRLDIQALNARLDRRFGSDLVLARAVADALPPYLQRPRFQAVLFGSVAAIGLLLAAVGLYAVAAFEVARRRFELGVRLSLGATASDIRRLVIRGALRPVVAGSAAGLVGTWWAAQFLQAFVFEVDARDPWTYGLVALVLVATTVVAAWIPASRAARTDPSVVLRAT